ncbi:unnamed protein product [Spirodela intermedia]|uniref:HMA domain-containing protein n=1 Tax=Spirodela intermedia TaxID=51605 RepID=A0A7I8KU77_SPIIN|nr:unnamed protein product [Spirodela intermedia]
MGVVSTFECLSSVWSHRHTKEKKKKRLLQTVELKVRMDCDGCELKVKKALSSMKGVQTVEINRKQQKVTVTGFVEGSKVLKKAKSTGNKAEIWPYIPFNLVAHPYAALSYDKKAPPGFVRYVEPLAAPPAYGGGKHEDQLAALFSDDNPNACSVM